MKRSGSEIICEFYNEFFRLSNREWRNIRNVSKRWTVEFCLLEYFHIFSKVEMYFSFFNTVALVKPLQIGNVLIEFNKRSHVTLIDKF
jgi:hypothetical protein